METAIDKNVGNDSTSEAMDLTTKGFNGRTKGATGYTSVYVKGVFDGATAQLQINPYAVGADDYDANDWYDVDGGSFTDATTNTIRTVKSIDFTAKQIRYTVDNSGSVNTDITIVLG